MFIHHTTNLSGQTIEAFLISIAHLEPFTVGIKRANFLTRMKAALVFFLLARIIFVEI